MAYSALNPPIKMAGSVSGPVWWNYSSTDTALVVSQPDYFTNGGALGMKVGDTIRVHNSTDNVVSDMSVTEAVVAGSASARDLISSVAPRSLFDFGGQLGNSAANAAASTAAWTDWATNSEENLFVPADPDNVGFYFDTLTPPRRSVYGATRRSQLTAASGFAPFSATFFDANETLVGTVYENLSLVGGSGVEVCFGNDKETTNTPTSHMQIRNCGIHGGTEYAVGWTGTFSDFSSNSGVGARFESCFFKPATSNGGWINLVQGCDDMIFDHIRCSMPGGEMNNQLIHVSATIVNLSFKSFFMNTLRDYESGSSADSIFKVKSGATAVTWDRAYIELTPAGITHTKMKYFADIESGKAAMRDVWMQNTGGTAVIFPANSAFAKVSNGIVRIHNCISQIANMDHVVAMRNVGNSIVNLSGNDIGDNTGAVTNFTTSTTSGVDVMTLHGEHRGESYDHGVSHDGASLIVTDLRQVVAEVTFAAGTATVAGAGTAVKLTAVTTQKGDSSGFTVGTDNTLTTLKPGFRRYRIQAMFLVDIASGTDNVTLHVYSSAASIFETAAQSITSATAKLFEIDVVKEIDITKTIEIYAENEDAVVNVTTAAFAERVDTTPSHGYLRVTQI